MRAHSIRNLVLVITTIAAIAPVAFGADSPATKPTRDSVLHPPFDWVSTGPILSIDSAGRERLAAMIGRLQTGAEKDLY